MKRELHTYTYNDKTGNVLFINAIDIKTATWLMEKTYDIDPTSPDYHIGQALNPSVYFTGAVKKCISTNSYSKQ